MTLDRKSPKPLYLQLEEILRNKIENKEILPHQPIPSENELSKQFNLSRMTVRGVLTSLVNEGLLYRVPGKGTFVAKEKITTAPITQMGIREQLEAMGYETATTVIDKKIDKASRKVAEFLSIHADSEVYVLERLRYASGEPLSIHTTYIPMALCSDLFNKNIGDFPLCNILERNYNIVGKRGVETLDTVPAGADEAKLLKVKKGYPLLLLRYVMYSQDEIPFEYAVVLIRGDRLQLKFEFSR